MKKPVIFIKDADPPWERCTTLGDFIERMLLENKDAEVIALMRSLPEGIRIKYRPLWVKHRGKK